MLAWAARAGPAAPTTAATQIGVAAQPRRSARAGAPASCRSAWSSRRRERRRRRARRRGRGRRACSSTRDRAVGETTAGGETELVAGDARRSRRSSAACASGSRAEAFFQTNTEMAERLYGVAAEYAGAAGLGARLRPVLRDRHDRPVAGAARRRGLGPGDRRGGGRRRDRQRPRQRDRQRAASSPATCASALRELVEKAGRPDVVVVDPPRAGLSQKVVRRDHRGRAEAHRLRLVQPDDAGAQRRAARRGRLRAAQRAPGRHVPADAAHRVRRAAGARLVSLPQRGARRRGPSGRRGSGRP